MLITVNDNHVHILSSTQQDKYVAVCVNFGGWNCYVCDCRSSDRRGRDRHVRHCHKTINYRSYI